MIAKISAIENLGGALGYNFKKVEKGDAEVILSKGLYQSAEGEFKMEEVLRDMQALIPTYCRTKKAVFHCSLNPHPDEHLSDERLATLAEDYMQALGYGSQPYIVFKHHDIEREHIHIVSLRVNEQGEKINDGFEKRRSKRITDALEQKYGLIPSTPTKEQVLQKASTEKPLNESVENRKTKVEKVLRAVLAHYKFASLGELNAILAHYHLTAEEVKTEVRGKRYDGLVYLLTDDEGKKESMPIAASELGRGLGYTAITNHIKRSKSAQKTDIPKVRQRVLMAMRTSPSSEVDLKKSLIQQGLRVVLRRNKVGRIYGITFIDDKEGIALNGSRLGKGYSANVFAQYLQDNGQNPFLDERRYPNSLWKSAEGREKTRDISQKNSHVFPKKSDVFSEKSHVSHDNSESDNLIDEHLDDTLETLAAPAGNDDWKEAAWQRKLRRQSRVRLPRRKH